MESQNNIDLVAYCGLYCGNCGQYKRGKCAGCRAGGGFSRCAVRKCCNTLEISSCADCGQFEQLADCKKLNGFISKIFGFIFGSDRLGNIAGIREYGLDAWVAKKQLTDKP